MAAKELKTLFSPGKIGNVQIKNRIVRSATFEGRALKGGFVSDELIDFYADLARGGVGLIISGFIAIDPSGTISQYQACLDDDGVLSGQKKLINAIHDYSDVKIAAQLGHSGWQGTHPKFQPIAPSAVPCKLTGLFPREMTIDEIVSYVQKFINASRRAFESGYDMVQIHAAHGYLLSNFVSPYTNRRTDEFGGNIQKRAKILVDIYKGIREELGKNFPITIKLQTQDFFPEGLMLEEGVKIAKILVDTGYDAIEPSGGGGLALSGSKDTYPSLKIKSPEDENYFLPMVKKLRPITKKCPLILMGGIKNPIFAEKVIKDRIADFIAMSRPLIYESDLPNRWMNGDLSPAKCTSCNACYMTAISGPVYCIFKKRLDNKKAKNKEKLQKKEKNE